MLSKLGFLIKKICFRFFEGGVISIRMSIDVPDDVSPDLRVIKYSTYPTMDDIHYIIDLTDPLHIFTIGDPKRVPFNLKHACRYNNNDNKSIEFSTKL